MTTLTGDAAREYLADLINKNKYDEAEPLLLDALRRAPDAPFLLVALGMLYRSTERPAASEACYRRALALNPRDAEAWSNLGNLLTDIDRLDEALEASERAVALGPKSYLFRKNLAITLRECKLFDRARDEFQACLAVRPDDVNVRFNLGMVQLYRRELGMAWDYFEERFATNRISMPDLKDIPRWTGEDLKGKRLLLVAEQGFGDTILMARFIPLLVARGAAVTLACKSALHRLFRDLPASLIGDAAIRRDDFDFHAPMMSVPRLTEPDWLRWPAAPPFTGVANEKLTEAMAGIPDGSLKIGVVWSGSVTYGENKKRSVSLDRFLALAARFPQIRFYSFQKGEREADLKAQGQGTIVPLGPLLGDFAETAAALSQMDCILMTDSALAHLAGALGVPVIDLLHFKPYWLYFPETATTPLYPSLRFIRQQKPGDWDGVFAQVEALMRRLAASPSPRDAASLLRLIDGGEATAKKGANPGKPAKAAKGKSRR